MIQARIDRMEELDQTIIKTAAVLGLMFPRRMLEAILQVRVSSEGVSDSLERLAKAGVFACASQIHSVLGGKRGTGHVDRKADTSGIRVGGHSRALPQSSCFCLTALLRW